VLPGEKQPTKMGRGKKGARNGIKKKNWNIAIIKRVERGKGTVLNSMGRGTSYELGVCGRERAAKEESLSAHPCYTGTGVGRPP